MPDKPTFDLFLSHNSVDKPWVVQLKADLARYGVSVWLDQDEIRPGDLFAKALEQGLAQSRAVALVVSPEAMASGWVEEEYYRALSLAKDKEAPLQLIPVILRAAELPGFIKSRNRVDFRDEANYAQNVWTLVWGITGHKPPEVLDLTAPAYTPPPAKPLPQSSQSPQPGLRTGGIKAKNIRAKNVVTGVQIQGGGAEVVQAATDLARNMQTGGIEASEELSADQVVDGFQYLGQGGTEPTLEQFRQELTALRDQLAQAIAAGEFADEYEAQDAQTALERVAEQTQADQPVADKISRQLDAATILLDRTAQAAQAAGKLGATVIKLAPLVTRLSQLVEQIF